MKISETSLSSEICQKKFPSACDPPKQHNRNNLQLFSYYCRIYYISIDLFRIQLVRAIVVAAQ